MIFEGVFYFIAMISLGVGIFIYTRPKQMFEIQRRFYELINWKIEPISIEKEIRSTRWMGLFLIGFVAVVFLYKLIKG
jgi:hypothetical protein